MTKLLLIGLGGSLGAIARYLLSSWVQERIDGDFPGGTFVVNALGCLVIGGLMYFAQEDRQLLSENVRMLLVVGLLGSMTTFSTFGYETFLLIDGGHLRLALGSILANVIVGLLAVWLGWGTARLIST